MARDNAISRRTALKVTGATAATALVAGCSDDDNGDDNGDDTMEYEAEPDEEIIFFGDGDGWEGESPSDIDGEENPTLVLEEGESYTIGWEEGDGQPHNIEIRDDGEEVVDGHETPEVDEPEGDDQMLDFEATDDMAYYVCQPHDGAMRGEIDVQ